mmetsp:Transcript_77891/g.241990  ORF Transcript_77891/g.241990 Transcript_77891/m.241990 type:complete len:256 (+) Transcript_77891:443-1210(+)
MGCLASGRVGGHKGCGHLRQQVGGRGAQVHEVHGDAELALALHLRQVALQEMNVEAQEAEPPEEAEAVVRPAALFGQLGEGALEQGQVRAAVAAAERGAAHRRRESGRPLVRLGADVLAEDRRRDEGHAGARGEQAVADLHEVPLVVLQRGHRRQLAEDLVHEALDGRVPRLEVVRADQHCDVRGPARDDLVEPAADVLRALHVHARVDHRRGRLQDLGQVLPEAADPVCGQVATCEAVPKADHWWGHRLRLVPT